MGYEFAWVQEEEERLKERLHEMAEYQSNDFSFKVAYDLLSSTSVNISIMHPCSTFMYLWYHIAGLRFGESTSKAGRQEQWRSVAAMALVLCCVDRYNSRIAVNGGELGHSRPQLAQDQDHRAHRHQLG